jgi:7-cyano-7-deazaguanine synthase in queuosine biosynthesis
MGFGEIITAIGGSAVLFGAMAWLVRSVINHFLSKDLEKFKLNLQRESQQELMRLQSSLQLVELEHQIRFSKLHERRAEIIAELYTRAVGLYRAASAFVKLYQSLDEAKNKENIKSLWNAADKFRNYFDEHRIYFNENTCTTIDSFNEALSKACSNLIVFIQDAPALNLTTAQIWDEWNKTMTLMEGDVPKIRKSLEESFREILGVLKPERLT